MIRAAAKNTAKKSGGKTSTGSSAAEKRGKTAPDAPDARARQSAAKQSPGRTFTLIDVQRLSADSPGSGVKLFTLNQRPAVIKCDILIAGGGMGGIAAALSCFLPGLSICLTEETDWLGGQMTSQGVSALDENYLVETSGASRSYQNLRKAIRDHYRLLPGISKDAAADERLNPGNCWVSRLSFEPQVALAQLDLILRGAIESGALKIFLRHKSVRVKVERGRVKSALMVDLDTGAFSEFRPRFVLDATELGDLLPLANIPFSTGAESREETGEPHAPRTPNPENVQDFVYPFVVEFRPGKSHVIAKPPHYDEFKQAGKFSFLNYKMFTGADAVTPEGNQAHYLPFWEYRRLVARQNFSQSAYKYDISMINWESNDLRSENIIDKEPAAVAKTLALAKNLSLGFLFWLQSESPRDDGGKGYPELFLRTDVLGTADGLSKYPYIRESRRIKAKRTITENDIAAATTSGARARLFPDSVGIGLYPIDIHGRQEVPGAGQSSRPFQIPLSAMIQDKVRNLLPACKNIGTTHVTNGAYRLHPVEWAIGEAAGIVAAFCRRHNTNPLSIIRNKRKLRSIQKQLAERGSPLFWFADVAVEHPSFAAIQFLSASSLMQADKNSLNFRPDDQITRAEAAVCLARILPARKTPTVAASCPASKTSAKKSKSTTPGDVAADYSGRAAILACLEEGILSLRPGGRFCPDEPLSRHELVEAAAASRLDKAFTKEGAGLLTRACFADWLYQVATSKQHFGRF